MKSKKLSWIAEWNQYEKQKRKTRLAARKRRQTDQVVKGVIGFVLKLFNGKK